MERVRMRDCPDGSRRADISNMYSGTDAVDKTAAYTVLLADRGKLFTNNGASGSVTITLPTDSTVPVGWWCDFSVEAAQTLVIAATSINGATTLTAAGSQNGVGFARVIMAGDGKYRAILVGTWS